MPLSSATRMPSFASSRSRVATTNLPMSHSA
jgi:hypothetical protein